jgi:hypothetical protein
MKKEILASIFNLSLAIVAVTGFYFTESAWCFLVLLLMVRVTYPKRHLTPRAVDPPSASVDEGDFENPAGN